MPRLKFCQLAIEGILNHRLRGDNLDRASVSIDPHACYGQPSRLRRSDQTGNVALPESAGGACH